MSVAICLLLAVFVFGCSLFDVCCSLLVADCCVLLILRRVFLLCDVCCVLFVA